MKTKFILIVQLFFLAGEVFLSNALSDIQNINFLKNKKCIDDINHKIRLTNNPEYNIFIAGHTYGSPLDKNYATYPKFYKKLLKDGDIYDFGIFAGDLVRKKNKKNWKILFKELDQLNYKIYAAPGNHDIDQKKNSINNIYFKKKFDKLYKSFIYKNDLFIIINSVENRWSIKGQQLNFLRKKLNQHHQTVDNIFIISHHVIFLNKDFDLKVNSESDKGNNLNFWDEIYPLLKKYSNNYYIVAGDIGAFKNRYELFCKNLDQNIFLATGMGGGERDNYLIFRKFNTKIKITVEKF